MKILKLLNKKFFTIIFFLLLGLNSYAENQDQPIDIWNTEKIKKKNNTSNQEIIIKDEENSQTSFQSDIYKMQPATNSSNIEFEQNLNSNDIKIVGLYDPEDFALDINMWTNSDGDQIKNIFSKLKKMNLSKDASEILNISILTNAYYPEKILQKKNF